MTQGHRCGKWKLVVESPRCYKKYHVCVTRRDSPAIRFDLSDQVRFLLPSSNLHNHARRLCVHFETAVSKESSRTLDQITGKFEN